MPGYVPVHQNGTPPDTALGVLLMVDEPAAQSVQGRHHAFSLVKYRSSAVAERPRDARCNL